MKLTYPWEKVDPLKELQDTVQLLQQDFAYALKYTAILVRSSNPDLCLIVNTERGPNIPSGKACFVASAAAQVDKGTYPQNEEATASSLYTTIEMQDIGMPQPGIPLMTMGELAKFILQKTQELGLELV
jgi:hypothetical protein